MTTALAVRTQRADSVEYVTLTVTSDVELDQQPVAMAVVPYGTDPGEDDWHIVEWLGGEPSTSRGIRLLVGPGSDVGQLDPGSYVVLWRITDTPEIPVQAACHLRIV